MTCKLLMLMVFTVKLELLNLRFKKKIIILQTQRSKEGVPNQFFELILKLNQYRIIKNENMCICALC